MSTVLILKCVKIKLFILQYGLKVLCNDQVEKYLLHFAVADIFNKLSVSKHNHDNYYLAALQKPLFCIIYDNLESKKMLHCLLPTF